MIGGNAMTRLIFLFFMLILVVGASQAKVENWLYYPVLSQLDIAEGNFFTDETALRPHRVQLEISRSTIKAIQLQNAIIDPDDVIADDEIELAKEDIDTYLYEFQDDKIEGTIRLVWQGDVLVGMGEFLHPDGYLRWDFLLAPDDIRDPRRDLAGERCGVISRLRPGMQATTPWYQGGSDTFDKADGKRITGTAIDVVILDESYCARNTMWWKVRVESTTDRRRTPFIGWMMENDGYEYRLNPVNPSEKTIFYCPGVPAPRLVVNGRGRVMPGLGSNNMRSFPSVDGRLVTQIQERDRFEILDGPLCVDGFVWWEVEYGRSIGWTAEGQRGTYWLRPVIPTE
jgi:hypothetical protein